jgi:hypothetical protein
MQIAAVGLVYDFFGLLLAHYDVLKYAKVELV